MDSTYDFNLSGGEKLGLLAKFGTRSEFGREILWERAYFESLNEHSRVATMLFVLPDHSNTLLGTYDHICTPSGPTSGPVTMNPTISGDSLRTHVVAVCLRDLMISEMARGQPNEL